MSLADQQIHDKMLDGEKAHKHWERLLKVYCKSESTYTGYKTHISAFMKWRPVYRASEFDIRDFTERFADEKESDPDFIPSRPLQKMRRAAMSWYIKECKIDIVFNKLSSYETKEDPDKEPPHSHWSEKEVEVMSKGHNKNFKKDYENEQHRLSVRLLYDIAGRFQDLKYLKFDQFLDKGVTK